MQLQVACITNAENFNHLHTCYGKESQDIGSKQAHFTIWLPINTAVKKL